MDLDPDLDSGFGFRIRIPESGIRIRILDSGFGFRIWIPDSYSGFGIRIADADYRFGFRIRIPDSESGSGSRRAKMIHKNRKKQDADPYPDMDTDP